MSARQQLEDEGQGRDPVGGGASSARRPPHVPEGDAGAPIQSELPAPDDAPLPPANASGVDKVPTDQQSQPIDDSSMYDRRPEQDKDRPPSQRET